MMQILINRLTALEVSSQKNLFAEQTMHKKTEKRKTGTLLQIFHKKYIRDTISIKTSPTVCVLGRVLYKSSEADWLTGDCFLLFLGRADTRQRHMQCVKNLADETLEKLPWLPRTDKHFTVQMGNLSQQFWFP